MNCQGRRLGSLFVSYCSFILLTACGQGHTGWNTFPVPVYVDSALTANAASNQDLQDGMKFWEDQVGQKLFSVQGAWSGDLPYTGDPSNPTTMKENVIYMPPTWPFASAYVGMTVVKPFSSGQMAMVMVNPSTGFCNGDCRGNDYQTSLRKTLAHELGHFIGLQHVQDPTNIMYPTSLPGGVITSLTVDETTLKTLTLTAGK